VRSLLGFKIAELRAWGGLVAGLRLLWACSCPVVADAVQVVGASGCRCLSADLGVGVGLCPGDVGLQLRCWCGGVADSKLWTCRCSVLAGGRVCRGCCVAPVSVLRGVIAGCVYCLLLGFLQGKC
jgi:hypothetical protein